MRAGALKFDGASGVATVTDADALDNTSAFTLTYWFRAAAYPADSAGLVSKRDSATLNNAYTTYLKAADKHIYVDVDNSNNRFSSSALISTGLWYHVALTFDGTLPSSQRVALWINGTLDVTSTETSATIPNYTSHLRIGNTHSGAVNWFNGLVDDVRFYRRALSAGEIQTLAQTNLAPSVFAGLAPTATNHLPASLNGSAIDDGQGGPLTTTWSKVTGPGNTTFNNAASLSTTVTFDKTGSYKLRLAASDSQVTVCDELLVNVSPNTNYYGDWIAQFYPGTEDPMLIGIEADPDGDKSRNLIEFALGTSPAFTTPTLFKTDSFPTICLLGL